MKWFVKVTQQEFQTHLFFTGLRIFFPLLALSDYYYFSNVKIKWVNSVKKKKEAELWMLSGLAQPWAVQWMMCKEHPNTPQRGEQKTKDSIKAFSVKFPDSQPDSTRVRRPACFATCQLHTCDLPPCPQSLLHKIMITLPLSCELVRVEESCKTPCSVPGNSRCPKNCCLGNS